MSSNIIYGVPYIPFESQVDYPLGKGWTDEAPVHQHYGWAWAIVVVLIIIVIIFIIFRRNWEDKSQFGTYSEPMFGPCSGTNSCTDPGRRTVTRVCQPHPVTGKGCLIPSGNREGQQSYESLVTIEECDPLCVQSKWKEVTAENTVCETSYQGCVPEGTFGIKRKRYQCVANDETGVNQCTNWGLSLLSGPTSEVGVNPSLETYQIGDQVTIKTPCQDFDLPTCGEWLSIYPTAVGESLLDEPSEVNIHSDQIQPCLFNLNLSPVSDCIVTDDPFGQDVRWLSLKEGYQLSPMSCVFSSESVIRDNQDLPRRKDPNRTFYQVTPLSRDQPFPLCKKLSPPNCNNQPISPQQIIDGTLPISPVTNDPVALLCPKNNHPSANPVCFNPCRAYHTTLGNVAEGRFNDIIGNTLRIRLPSGFLSLEHIPSHLSNVQMLQDTKSSTLEPLFNVPTMVIPYRLTQKPVQRNSRFQQSSCNQSEIEFYSSLLLILGPRNVSHNSFQEPFQEPFQSLKEVRSSRNVRSSNILITQIMGLIGADYLGWMGYNGETMIWYQAYNVYQGPGIASINPLATNFQITINSGLSGTSLGESSSEDIPGNLGKISINIRGPGGEIITVSGLDGSSSTLDNVEAVVYDSALLNSDINNNQKRINCNLFFRN